MSEYKRLTEKVKQKIYKKVLTIAEKWCMI